jgi:hypothetical protein
MGYLYRPKLKDPEAPAGAPRTRYTHERHGREDRCTGRGARFSPVWWMKYYDNGKAVRESTETMKETETKRVLKDREGKVGIGQPMAPPRQPDPVRGSAADLRTHYTTTGERDKTEAEGRLAHLDVFFHTKRIASIGKADVTRYIAAREAEGAANGTINRELAVLGRMLRLAYESGKLMRLPLIHKLKEPAPPELVEMLQAQEERVQLLEMTTGRKTPHLFPYLSGEHEGERIQDFRVAWKTACREATLKGLEGEARVHHADRALTLARTGRPFGGVHQSKRLGEDGVDVSRGGCNGGGLVPPPRQQYNRQGGRAFFGRPGDIPAGDFRHVEIGDDDVNLGLTEQA